MTIHHSRVAKGAALLDEMEPGWYQKIDLDTLSLGSCSTCVIGQLYGYYCERSLIALGLDYESDYIFGFDAQFRNGQYEEETYLTLTSLWREEINQRLQQENNQ